MVIPGRLCCRKPERNNQYSELPQEDPLGNNEEEQSKLGSGDHDSLEVYTRRWYVLMVFSLLSFTQGLVWNTWGPIFDSAQAAFGWSRGQVGLFPAVANSAFSCCIFFTSWIMDTMGLRVASLMSGVFLVVGSGLRCIPSSDQAFYGLSMVCSVLVGVAGTVPFGGPAKFSALWFPVSQRATATAVSVKANFLGAATSFLLVPFIVPNKNSTSLHRDMSSLYTDGVSNTSGSMKDHSQRTKIMEFLYVEFGWSIFVFLLILVYFPAKPPSPPSTSASQARMGFLEGIAQLFRKWQWWAASLASVLPVASFGSWQSVFEINFQLIGVSQNTACLIGFFSSVAGVIGGIAISRLSDIFSGHIRTILLVMMVCATGSLTWATLLCQQYISMSLASLYTCVILSGLLVAGMLPLCYELCCEVCYPVAEGVIGGCLIFLARIIGIIYFGLLSAKSIGTSWMMWAQLASAVVAIPLLLTVRGRYSRLDIDTAPANSTHVQADDGVTRKDHDHIT